MKCGSLRGIIHGTGNTFKERSHDAIKHDLEENVKEFYAFVESVKKEEKTELQTRPKRNEKGMRELEKKLNNYRKAIESGVDISLVIEPINALKTEKENLEGTNRQLKARLENQPSPEAFRFSKTAYGNFSEMIRTVINT